MKNERFFFFVAGLLFGVLVGYFLFKTLQAEQPNPVSSAPPRAEEPAPRTLDTSEIAALERRAAADPADGDVRARIGTLYLEAGRYPEAERWLREAKERKPGDLHLRNHLALALENQQRYQDAEAEYEAALSLEAEHPESLLGLGRMKLYHRRDIRGGIALWEKLLAVAPDSAAAQSVRDELEALKSAHPGG
jgi:tetratricopeptide (TPR) repeat protein